MTLTLGTVITAARDRHSAFFRSRVTDAVLARYLSDAQNELIGAAVRRDPQYLAQTATIALSFDGSDAPGTAGAGTSGGTPGTTADDGTFGTVETTAGALVQALVTATEGAAVYVADRVCTSATSTTLTSTGANRTTNQDAARVLVITAGTGIGQRREITSNTSEIWTISQAWTTTPDATSIFDVVVPVYQSDNTSGVVTALPATTTSTGYLVRVTSHGVPYIDFTAPLVATIDAGVPLPAMQFPLDGTIWYADGTADPLRIVSADQRFSIAPAAYVVGQTLYLTGQTAVWAGVASIALRYVPIAPVFAALPDLFLLPDHAKPALVSKAASFMAMRVAGMPDVSIDPAPHHADAMRAESAFLANVSAAKRGRGLRTREVW